MKQKRILTVLSLMLFMAFTSIPPKKNNHWESENLKGRVKNCRETVEKALLKDNIVQSYYVETDINTFFNQNGYITHKDFYNENGNKYIHVTYSYDDDFNLLRKELNSLDSLIQEIDIYEIKNDKETYHLNIVNGIDVYDEFIIKDRKGNVKQTDRLDLEHEGFFIKTDYDYDREGNLIEVDINTESGFFGILYEYDKNNNQYIERTFGNDKLLLHTKFRKFNTQGDVIEEIIRDLDNEIVRTNRYQYEYDGHQNWTKKTHFIDKMESPVTNITRKIQYYK